MIAKQRTLIRSVFLLAGLALMAAGRAEAASEPDFHPIDATMAAQVVTLTGHDLSIDQVVAVARHGAKVALSAEALTRQSDAYGLVLEASAEGLPVYGFNRGAGAGREIALFKGDPTSPENSPILARRLADVITSGPRQGLGPPVMDEDVVRALMLVRVNTMTLEGVSPAMSRLLVDMLNARIAPVVQSRGSLGEGDLPQAGNLLGAMGGAGEVYYRGERMNAAQALRTAGLKPLDTDSVIYTPYLGSNAYSVGQAALLVADARQALDWTDLIYAMDLNAMNSSITPLVAPIRAIRPFKYTNLEAARVMDMIRGSYLLGEDTKRIIQDPESLRASFSRQGAAWKAWAGLRDTVQLQLNSSDHNPAALVGASPTDSWELSAPQLMKYYVKGGPLSHGQHGYVISNANWDPYPMANEVEALTGALANMDVAVVLRLHRFDSPFFTVVTPKDVLTPEQMAAAPPASGGYDPTAIWQEIQGASHTLTPEGDSIAQGVEELQAETVAKVGKARQVVDDTLQLLGQDLLTATYWLDVRRIQDPSRLFGVAPTAAWAAFRKVVPWSQTAAERSGTPLGELTYRFLTATPASTFYPAASRYIDADEPTSRP